MEEDGITNLTQTNKQPAGDIQTQLTSEQPQKVLWNPTKVVPADDGEAMPSPLENQTFQRNPNIVQQQSSPNAPIQPKSPVQQSPALDTPAIEVIAVSDVYVDGFTVAHGGIVICKKTLETCSDDDCGKTFESFSFSSPDDDGTSGLSFQPEEVMKIFMYPEKEIFGILFSPKCEYKYMILDMNLAFPQDDFSYFKDKFFQMFVNKVTSVTTLRNQKEAKKYVTSNFTRGIEVWRMVFGKKARLLRIWGTKPIHPTFEFFRPYLRCYTNFVKENPVKRDGKKILRKIDDFPKFLKLYSGSFSLLQPLLFSFLVQHTCRNTGCKKFSYLKCQACRGIYYCGKDCQVANWNSHREHCQEIQDIRAKVELVPNLLETEAQSTQGNEPISFEAFFGEISYKMFEAAYDSLKTPDLSFLFRKDSILASRDVAQLVRRRGIKSQKLKSLEKQIFKAFGEKWDFQKLNHMFSIMPKP